jgi:hypothetical protein
MDDGGRWRKRDLLAAKSADKGPRRNFLTDSSAFFGGSTFNFQT